MAPTCRSGAKAALLLLLVLTATSGVARAAAPQVPAVIVFGDSTVDTGNNNQIPTPLRADFPPYGRDMPGGPRATGRFGNGRLPPDLISEALGLPPLVPAYLDPAYGIDDFARGVCFASAGTGIDNATAGVLFVSLIAIEQTAWCVSPCSLEGDVRFCPCPKMKAVAFVPSHTNPDPTLPAHPHPGDPAGPGATAATFGPHAAGRRCSDPAGRRHDRPLARRKTDAEATGARAGCRRVPRQARRQGPRRAWLAHRVRGAGGQRKGRRCRRGRRPRPGARGSQRTGRAGPDGHGWGHGRQGLARSRPRPGVLRRRRRPTPSPPRRGSMLCRSRMEILVRYCRMTSRDGAHRGSGSASSSSPADAEDSMNSSSDRALPELRAKLLRRPP